MNNGTNYAAKILIIEDDEIQRRILKEILTHLSKISKYSFHAKLVSTGKKGLQTAIQFRPDLIFLDIHLPDIHGIQLLRQLESNNMLDDTPVLLITSDTSEATAIEGLAAGAKDIIYKPIRETELAIKMANILESKRNQTALSKINNQLEKEKQIFSKFFSNDIMDKILQDESFSKLGGINTFATIMFFDLRNSTSLAETLGAQEFATFLCDIFENITNIIYSNYGSVNKFMGDGILATFGCPVVYSNDAYNAARSAIKIREFIKIYNETRPPKIKDPIALGIGIASGKIFAGNIGSHNRMEYTVLGDPVNVASRLESLTKMVKTDILIEENTINIIEDVIYAEKIDLSNIRGRIGEINIYKLLEINEKRAHEIYAKTEQITFDNMEKIGEVEFF
ncbi:MAG: adenylate/guanylate cyclase domain-containing response regulator [Spirochaetia bacterium]|nr:adenylate/guanylate cyclase domain-containing response regulator [Spirochaetia bacterium]